MKEKHSLYIGREREKVIVKRERERERETNRENILYIYSERECERQGEEVIEPERALYVSTDLEREIDSSRESVRESKREREREYYIYIYIYS